VGHLFDKLAKDVAEDLPRRQAFRRLGGGLLGIVLAAVGLAADTTKSACAQFCVDCCSLSFSHPREGGEGREFAECIRNCHNGIATVTSAGALVCGPEIIGNPCIPNG
jgi:hypothetical protein